MTLAIRSSCSLQKSDPERFPQVTHDKRAMRAMGAICSFSQANHFFAQKNEQIARKTDERIPNTLSQDVRGLKMILMDKAWVPGILLDV